MEVVECAALGEITQRNEGASRQKQEGANAFIYQKQLTNHTTQTPNQRS